MTTTVLWPDDARGAGFVFGWRTPAVVCVAGLLAAPTVRPPTISPPLN